ncbi:MAG: hypothetical protein IT373_33170 [Polyangiaceae bacterium]|nr:hypothetical protein [Polyangiaceae bacterium]
MSDLARPRRLRALHTGSAACALALAAGCVPGAAHPELPRPTEAAGVSVWLDPPIDPAVASAVGVLPDGRTAFVLGGHRLALGAGAADWASARFATPIVGATRVASGWLFAAADGAVGRAPEVLGPLERLGGPAEAVAVALLGSGRAGLVTASGALYTSDGSADFARAPLPQGVRATGGAFADARHGVVLAEGGAAYATTDGGASFAPLPLGLEAAWRVDLAGRALVVTTTAGAHVVTEAGALAPVPPGLVADTGVSWLPPAPLHHGPGRAFFPRARELEVVASRWARFPASAALAGAAPDGVLHDGRVVHSEPGELVLLDPATGARATLPLGEGMPADRSCSIHRFGAGLVAACDADRGPGAVWRLDGTSPPARVPGLAPGPFVAFSDDGVHAAWLGACDAVEGEGAARKLCAYAGGATRELALDLEADELVAVRGARALVTGAGDAGAASARVVDLEGGTLLPLRVQAEAEGGPALELERASFATADVVAAVVRAGASAPARSLAIGRPEEPLALRALPPGARAVGLVDAERGVAAGRTAAELWTTSDGGQIWRATPAVVDGASDGIRLADARSAPDIVCDGHGCSVSGAVYVRFEPQAGASPPPLPLARAAGGAPTPTPPDEGELDFDGEPVSRSAAAPACNLVPTPDAPDPEPLPPSTYPPSAAREARVLELGRGGVRARLDIVPRPDWRAELVWRPLGAAEPLATGPWPVGVEHPEEDAVGTAAASYALVGAEAEQALVARCSGARGDRACELLRGTPEHALTIVTRIAAVAAPPNTSSPVVALGLPDGGALLLVASRPSGLADGIALPSLDLVLRVGADGSLAGRRAFAWTERPRRYSGLAQRQGVAGYVASAPDAPERLDFYPLARDLGAGPEPFATLATLRVPRCGAPGAGGAGAKSPGAAHVWLPASATRVGIAHDLGVLEGIATLDLSGTGACLAAFDSALELPVPGLGAPDPRANLHLEARGGELVGSLVTGDGRARARCGR